MSRGCPGPTLLRELERFFDRVPHPLAFGPDGPRLRDLSRLRERFWSFYFLILAHSQPSLPVGREVKECSHPFGSAQDKLLCRVWNSYLRPGPQESFFPYPARPAAARRLFKSSPAMAAGEGLCYGTTNLRR